MVGIKAAGVAVAALAALVLPAKAQAVFGPQIRAGAARVEITPSLKKYGPVYMAGFGHNRIATDIHDDLYARCLALSAGGQTVVICGVDSIGLFADDVEKIREEVKKRAAAKTKGGAGGLSVVVAATHDHQAPDTMGLWGPSEGQSGINEAYNSFVVERVAEAAVNAVRHMTLAVIRLGQAHPSELDGMIHDDRPPEVHDAGVIVLEARRPNGDSIGTLVNWANHPETLGSKNTLITADYPHFLTTGLEARLGGVAVFVNGAVGGMQSPLGAVVPDGVTGKPAPENSFLKAEVIGRNVAEIASRAVRNGKTVNADRVDFQESRIEIPVANQGFQMAAKADLYKGRKKMTAGATDTSVGLVRLWGKGTLFLEIALVPGELYPELSVGGVERYAGADFPDAPIEPPIKKLMAPEFKMLVGLADDEIGYIIPKAEWDEKPPYLNHASEAWYGEVNSVGPEAAPRIAQAFERLLQQK
ncbi:MAG TPA: hypothetical protein VJN43_01100 [Bryobacteraceae bacterium]|nr:hypothetical protein [Bryobacteraceae bacterium]